MDFTKIVMPLLVALITQVVTTFIITVFGKGGTGILGELRTAISKSLPLPLSLTIWVVAI